MTEHLGDTKVANLDYSFLREEHISAFQVTMNDLAIVHMLHAEAHLSEQVQNVSLCEVATFLFLYLLADVTAVSEVHDNAKLALLGLKSFNEFDDVGVLQVLDDLCLL